MYFVGNVTVQTADNLISSRNRLRTSMTCVDMLSANVQNSAEAIFKADETF